MCVVNHYHGLREFNTSLISGGCMSHVRYVYPYVSTMLGDLGYNVSTIWKMVRKVMVVESLE